jgi:phage head maturation protease
MRFYFPIAKIDAEERMVWGYASTEARDEQGESVRRDALEAALDDYMRFANIREMHQLSAVGRTKEAGVDEKGLYIGARIVDPLAWAKVTEGVYNGFSIGGKVTARDPADRRIITGLKLDEISLVDRPANPEAVFDCWKAASPESLPEARMAGTPDQPLQIWHCGNDGHRHLAKAEAARCMQTKAPAAGAAERVIAEIADALARSEAAVGKSGESPEAADGVEHADPGYQPDGKKRYPIDSERHIRAAWHFIHQPGNAQRYTAEQLAAIKARIVAAWREKIDRDGPPEARPQAAERGGLGKAIADVGRLARILVDLHWLKDRLAEAPEGPQSQSLPPILDELCSLLDAFVADEACALLEDDGEAAAAAEAVVMAAGAAGGALVGRAVLRKVGNAQGGAFFEALLQARTAPGGHLLAAERAEKAALAGALAEIVPRIDALAKRVAEIAATPLPPLTVAKAATTLSKQQDGAGGGPQSADDLAAAFAGMRPEERAMILIKASYRNPIRIPA